MNNNLTAEVRPDKTGKMVTRHVRTDKGAAPAGRAASLSKAAPSLGTAKKKSFKKNWNEFSFDDAYRDDYVPATVEKVVEGDQWAGKSTSTGSKYSGYQRTAEIAKSLREDIKEAVAAGYLPDGPRYNVKASSASMTQDLVVSVVGLPDSRIYGGVGTDRWGDEKRLYSDFTEKLNERLEIMVNSYNRQVRDSGNDDHRTMYWGYVDVKDEAAVQWAADQAARKRRAREEAIEKNLM